MVTLLACLSIMQSCAYLISEDRYQRQFCREYWNDELRSEALGGVKDPEHVSIEKLYELEMMRACTKPKISATFDELFHERRAESVPYLHSRFRSSNNRWEQYRIIQILYDMRFRDIRTETYDLNFCELLDKSVYYQSYVVTSGKYPSEKAIKKLDYIFEGCGK